MYLAWEWVRKVESVRKRKIKSFYSIAKCILSFIHGTYTFYLYAINAKKTASGNLTVKRWNKFRMPFPWKTHIFECDGEKKWRIEFVKEVKWAIVHTLRKMNGKAEHKFKATVERIFIKTEKMTFSFLSEKSTKKNKYFSLFFFLFFLSRSWFNRFSHFIFVFDLTPWRFYQQKNK